MPTPEFFGPSEIPTDVMMHGVVSPAAEGNPRIEVELIGFDDVYSQIEVRILSHTFPGVTEIMYGALTQMLVNGLDKFTEEI